MASIDCECQLSNQFNLVYIVRYSTYTKGGRDWQENKSQLIHMQSVFCGGRAGPKWIPIRVDVRRSKEMKATT